MTIHRHWAVLLASTGALFTLWGLTPAQSGIFAVTAVNRTIEVPFARANGHVPMSQQATTISAETVQSAFSILRLNETLQPYMTREYSLNAFRPLQELAMDGSAGYWSFRTQKFSVNLTCETPVFGGNIYTSPIMNSSWGCSMFRPDPRSEPLTLDRNETIYDAQYIGYWNSDGNAVASLDGGQCPRNASNTLVLQWSKALTDGNAFSNALNYTGRIMHANVTTRFCRTRYYSQDCYATVSADASRQVIGCVPLDEPQNLPADFFNTTAFEIALARGQELPAVRTAFPTPYWPDQKGYYVNTELNYRTADPITLFALGSTTASFDGMLNPATLDDAYQAAIRLLFSRRMSDVLSSNLDLHTLGVGHTQITTQAVIMVPAFTYVTEGILIFLACLAASLLVLQKRRANGLISDPASISALMDLAMANEKFLTEFKPLDKYSSQKLNGAIGDHKFSLIPSRTGAPTLTVDPHICEVKAGNTNKNKRASKILSAVKVVQPSEFSFKIGLSFLAAQIALLVAINILSRNIAANGGLSLPSRFEVIRKLLENYLPLLAATLLESVWLVINRHLCALQPFEALRKGESQAKDSIDLDYSSVPPQFALIRALKKRHIFLGIVCAMPFLASLLSVAMSGFLFESNVQITHPSNLSRPHELLFNFINGSGEVFTPNNTRMSDVWYVATSNITASTPMPPWTDDDFFYLPFNASSDLNIRARTPAVGSRLRCTNQDAHSMLNVSGPPSMNYATTQISTSANLTLTMPLNSMNDRNATCRTSPNPNLSTTFEMDPFVGSMAMEFNTRFHPASENATLEEIQFCNSLVAAAWIRADGERHYNRINDSYVNSTFDIHSWDATLVTCQTELIHGVADITVDRNGFILERHSFNESQDSVTSLFPYTNSSALDLIAQYEYFFVDSSLSWHIDDHPSDFVNYLIAAQWNDTSAIDPRMGIPPAKVIVPRYEAMYNKMFAIFMGRNYDLLLRQAGSNDSIDLNATIAAISSQKLAGLSSGVLLATETRVFRSLPFLIIAEVILTLYILTTIMVYLFRPWRILARMPDTPASIIAYFAASNAIAQRRKRDSERADTVAKAVQHYINDQATEPLLDDVKYSFGSYMGTDGLMKVGIDDAHHVESLPLDRKMTDESGKTGLLTWLHDLRHRNRRKVIIKY